MNSLGRTILKNVSLKIDKGEKIFIGGSTGSGKTTILKIISGLIPNLYKGKIYGLVKTLKPHGIYLISQHPEEQIIMDKALDEAAYPLICRGFTWNSAREKIVKLARSLNLEYLLNRKTSQISEGEKQLIHILSALAVKSDCIILDEPSAHLYPDTVIKILNFLLKTDKTVIVADHRPYGKYDRYFLLENGEIIEEKMKYESLCNFNFNKKIKISEYDLLKNSIGKGKILALVGLNGVGKTTLLKKLANVICKNYKVTVSYCAEYPYYHFSSGKVLDNVCEFWLNSFEIAELKERHVFSLSGGEARRVAIAKCFKAEALFLDEPTAGQDYKFKKILAENIKRYEKIAIVSTHDPWFTKFCDEVVKLES